MKRFLVGLGAGGAAGTVTWCLSHGNVALTIFIGLVVALTIWFTRLGDWLEEGGEAIGDAVSRGLDDIF